MDLNSCPGFDYDPVTRVISTVYYARDEMGCPLWDSTTNETVMEPTMREFTAKAAPSVVREHDA